MNPAWRDDAVCVSDPELWFADLRTGDAARARSFCAGCPVRYDCLDYAVRTRPVLGIWAGLDHNQIAAAYGHVHVCRRCAALFAGDRAHRPGYCSEVCRKAERREQQIRWDQRRRAGAAPQKVAS